MIDNRGGAGGNIGMELAAQPHVRSGRLRALAVTSSKRSPAVPELPTVAEAGVPGYEVDSWYGVLVPRGTPKEIVSTINREVLRLLQDDGVKEHLLRQGAAPAGRSPEQFETYIRGELLRWGKIIKAAGVRAE